MNDAKASSAALSGFQRLYQRAPDDGERVRLLNIARALGLEESSEWWIFFLAAEDCAGRISEAAARVESSVSAEAGCVAGVQVALDRLSDQLVGLTNSQASRLAARNDDAVAEPEQLAALIAGRIMSQMPIGSGVQIGAILRAFGLGGAFGFGAGVVLTWAVMR